MNYSIDQIKNIYVLAIPELLDKARATHKKNFADDIELCQLISVKTGGCPEDCAYCSQSNSANSEIKLNPLLPLIDIKKSINEAKAKGVKRICLGAAYRKPTTAAINKVCQYVKLIKDSGLEACATLGSLDYEQAMALKKAGLDYYNHNIDTSPEYYQEVVTTRNFADRLATIETIGNAGINVCCGGIIGMGESVEDRIRFIKALTDLPYPPTSIPINLLVKVPGTRLEKVPDLDKIELLRVIATVRIFFPSARIRLSAGRNQLTELEQASCIYAGANSIWSGEKLLTVANASIGKDEKLLTSLGINSHA